MTVGVAVKVYDGIVLAADSATTFPLASGSSQVYNNANKIFQLHRHKPIAAMTWGLGSIGSANIATLAKDLRRRFMGSDPGHLDWEVPDDYTVQAVVERVVEMFHALFATEFTGRRPPSSLGFLVAGFSPDGHHSEAWLLNFADASTPPTPEPVYAGDQFGWQTFAQPGPTTRLIQGYDPRLIGHLKAVLDPAVYEPIKELVVDQRALEEPMVLPAMPLVDAIDFARYLVDVTAGYRHFALGADTVGGPVEVAAMTRHEGFKWISRKHHFSAELNPEVRQS